MTVSVVIAAYNSELCIERALMSAVRQTSPPAEIIVADDCSTDNTHAKVEAFAVHWPTVKLLRMPRNRGPSAARNAAISVASGEWIAILDADDEWRLDRIEALERQANDLAADVLADNLIFYDQQARREGKTAFAPGSGPRLISITDLLKSDTPGIDPFSYGWLKPLFRTSFLRDSGLCYDETIRFGEDFHLYAEMLFGNAAFWLIDDAYYIYTTPVGEFSDQPSALQKTNASFSSILQNSDKLESQYAKIMTSDLRNIFRRRRRLIEANHITNLERQLRRSREYGKSLRLLISHPVALWLVVQRAFHKGSLILGRNA
jgi:succinoglycan biosynthesis protein ExoO